MSEQQMTKQDICFTIHSNATRLDIKSVKIDDDTLIYVDKTLTDKNVDDIVDMITNKPNAVTVAEIGPPANVNANTQLLPLVPSSTYALPPPPVDEGKLLSNSKFSKYTLTSLLDRLKQKSTNPSAETQTNLRKTIADELEKQIHNNTLSTSSSTEDILKALTELQNRHGVLKMQKKNKVTDIILGGSHLTRKSPHNRRRIQSTTQKGRRSSKSRSRRRR